MPSLVSSRQQLASPMPGVKIPRVMARQKFRKLLNLMRYARESHLAVRFICPACNQLAQLKRGETGLIELARPGPVNEKTDAFTLSCACTIWRVNP
jgi:hypothetical protein